jgi:hypothetical protein
MENQSYRLSNKEVRHRAARAVLDAPDFWTVDINPPKRSREQNDRMWAMLGEISRQVDWYGKKLSDIQWKDVFTAALREYEVVPGITPGTFVVLGMRTSKMNTKEMSDLMTLIDAFGKEKGVVFNDPKWRDE